LSVSPDEILITNGSQQCLDLIGKVFIDAGSHVSLERPGYLGVIPGILVIRASLPPGYPP